MKPDIGDHRAPGVSFLCAKCVRTALYGVLLEGIGRQGQPGISQLEGTIRYALGRDQIAKMTSNRTFNPGVAGSSPAWLTIFMPF
jgi:hypothetical protein